MKDVKNIIENTVKLIWKKKYTFQFYKVTAFGMKGECTVPPALTPRLICLKVGNLNISGSNWKWSIKTGSY